MTFDLMCKQILLEMNRRDFLKNIGKGAAAAAGSKVIPKSLVKAAIAAPKLTVLNLQSIIYTMVREIVLGQSAGAGAVYEIKLMKPLLAALKMIKPNSSVIPEIQSLLDDKYDPSLADSDFTEDDWNDAYYNEPKLESILMQLQSEKLITPDLAKKLYDEFEIDLGDFGDEDRQREADLEDRKEIDNSQSRFDKAGGSEDDGYARYYEHYMRKFGTDERA